MKAILKFYSAVLILFITVFLFSFNKNKNTSSHISFPYKHAGLTERQAAAHLLSRFTFGARPGDVDAVVNLGLEKWFQQQLNASIPDTELNRRLSEYDALKLSNTEIANTFPKPGQVIKMAVKDGFIDKDSVNRSDKPAYKEIVANYMEKNGFKPEKELFRQFANQKILRATYSNNQLQELLTDFWFNHFNVSITKNDCAEFIPDYERDVIRPNVLGKFDNLLLATAKSPAMLLYLDNFSSAGTDSIFQTQGNSMVAKRFQNQFQNQLQKKLGDSASAQLIKKFKNRKKDQGLNENYAREVMELHTLGVDGGYTQSDVTQAARVLTGWTVYPITNYGPENAIRKAIDAIGEDRLTERGFVHEGDFLFAINRHDDAEKVVLGKTFKAGGGYDEGVQLLEMLAHHSSTAKFISRKLAIRFVSDNPPQSLIDKMAKTFLTKDGDIKQVLITMVSSPEFWSKESVRQKTKSPFELAISTLRSLNADVKMPYLVYNWVDKMGQKLYYYQAPTGFPDKGQYWINTGALLNRMNFGLALATEKIPGIKIDLLKLNNGHEPESSEAALLTYGKIIMPERDLQQTVSRLKPLLNDPQLQQKVENKADNHPVVQQASVADNEMMAQTNMEKKPPVTTKIPTVVTEKGNANMLSQVVGIIIGSPEFQRK